jgi:lipid II:glycine glycyltransferase (peptidoglycan interpeptide bridge formation enzyme)
VKLAITISRKASPEEWDEIWRNCAYATYFHSREWAEIWNIYSKGKYCPEPRLILFSDGLRAIIPFSCCGKRWGGLIKEYISSPTEAYGGWISSDNLSLEHAKLLMEFIMGKYRNLLWRLNPFDDNINNIGIQHTDKITLAVKLSDGLAAVIKRFDRTNTVAIRKAQEYGVTIRVASTIQEWQEYFKAYQDSLTRWGSRIEKEFKYDWTLFENMYNRHSPNIRLWLAIFENKIISGALCLYAKKHVAYWHQASLRDYFIYRPVNLLNYEMIKDSYQNNYTWFDFLPSGELKGVIRFKKLFGPEILDCPKIYIKNRKKRID